MTEHTEKRLLALDAAPRPEVEPDLAYLLDAIRDRADDMARHSLEIYSQLDVETTMWGTEDQERFVAQSRRRIEAILDVTGAGDEIEEGLLNDLEAVGLGAAWSGNPLLPLLLALRISRDLIVQVGVELVESWGRRWSQTLSLLLNRVLPAVDRLTDALAQGYWAAPQEFASSS